MREELSSTPCGVVECPARSEPGLRGSCENEPHPLPDEAWPISLQSDRGELDLDIQRDVDVVGKEVQRDMSHDFDDLLVIESSAPQL